MEVVIKQKHSDYRVVRTEINWLVYCLHNGDNSWVGAINSYSNRGYKAVRIAVTELPPVKPLEQQLFSNVDDGINWIIGLSEHALNPDLIN